MPPRRTQAERSAETQGRLLDATIACVVERGYAGASSPEICKRAGVSRGAQLHHYPTKAALVAAAIERLFERRHGEFREWLAEGHELDASLEALWEIYSGETLTVWLELLVASRTDERLRENLRAVDDRFFEEAKLTFQRLFGVADDADVAALTRLTLSVFDGLSLNYTLGGREELTQRVVGLLRQIGRLIPEANREL